MAARFLVVDDHTLVRQGVVKLIQGADFIEVVGEASDGFEAMIKARDLKVDVVLTDLYMPSLDGIAMTRLLRRELPKVQVIVLTVSEDEDDLLEAIQAGARGYIVKTVDSMELIRQLKQVLTGGVAMTHDVTNRLVTGLARRGSNPLGNTRNDLEALTSREKEVLQQIAKGTSNKGIAAGLHISDNTVRAHVRTLMQKLNLSNRTQLAVYGIYHGFAGEGRSDPRAGGKSLSKKLSTPVEKLSVA